MRRIWVQSGRLFCRTPVLFLAAIVGYLILHIYMSMQMSLLHYYTDTVVFLNSGQAVGLLLFLLFAVLSYEFLAMERNCDLEECLSVNRRSQRQVMCGRICLLLPMALLTSATVFVYQFVGLRSQDALTGQVIVHLLLSCVLNIFLLQLIALLFGAALAASVGRPVAYTCIAVFAFLTTSFAKGWVSMLDVGYSAVGYAIMRFSDLFSLTAMDNNYITDNIYGQPIEPGRWIAALFWLFLFAAVFLWRTRVRSRRSARIPAAVSACAALALLVSFVSGVNDSTLRFDSRLTSANGAYQYELVTEQRSEEAAFDILSYRMELSAYRRLQARVEIEVSQNTEGEHYLFTLYRGYRVTSVTDGAGNKLSYERDGHYLDVQYPLDESTGTIVISYQGTGVWFFSNAQTVALPGCVPWYPIAGYSPFWDRATNTICLNIPEEEMDFTITFDTKLPMVSNLEQVDQNTWSGRAVSATFVGGLLEEKEEAGLTYYDSPLNTGELGLEQAQTRLATAEEILGMSLGLDLADCTIICLPGSISSTVGGVSLATVVLPDHVLFSSGAAIADYILEACIPEKEGADALYELVVYYLYCGVDADALYADGETVWQGLPDRSSIVTLEDIWDAAYNSSQAAFEQALRYQMNEYGASEVLRACYAYLQSDRTEDQVEFVYSLGDELS